MDELNLLRDYVTTMQREIASKNEEINTLERQYGKIIAENDRLKRQLQQSSKLNHNRNSSLEVNEAPNQTQVALRSDICAQCQQTKKQFQQIQAVCQQLQQKYDKLEQERNKNQQKHSFFLEKPSGGGEVKSNSQYKSTVRVLTTTTQSSSNCQACDRYKKQMSQKDETINNLQRELHQYNARISSLSVQLQRLEQMGYHNQENNREGSTRIVYQSVKEDVERISFLNGQVEQYMAMVNGMRNQIKMLTIESQNRLRFIRELEQRLKQKDESLQNENSVNLEIRQSIKLLKTEIGELSNDNIVLRRENQSLREDVKTLQYKLLMDKEQVMAVQQQNHMPQSPGALYENPQRAGRHYRKERSPAHYIVPQQQRGVPLQPQFHDFYQPQREKSPYNNGKSNSSAHQAKKGSKISSGTSSKKMNQYEELQRKIMELQFENQHLKKVFN